MNLNPESVLEQLKWRYAVKKFDATKSIPAELWSKLEDSLVLSPSSYGLQPWKFFVITDAATKAKLLPLSYGQNQVVDASHLVVFAVKSEVTAADAEKLIRTTSELRGVPETALAGYKQMIVNSLTSLSPEAVRNWMTHQVYIAHGVFLATAAMMGIDACPMEGFSPTKYDEVLGLPEKGYNSIVLATAGYRAADDKNATATKVRYPKSEIVEQL